MSLLRGRAISAPPAGSLGCGKEPNNGYFLSFVLRIVTDRIIEVLYCEKTQDVGYLVSRRWRGHDLRPIVAARSRAISVPFMRSRCPPAPADAAAYLHPDSRLPLFGNGTSPVGSSRSAPALKHLRITGQGSRHARPWASSHDSDRRTDIMGQGIGFVGRLIVATRAGLPRSKINHYRPIVCGCFVAREISSPN